LPDQSTEQPADAHAVLAPALQGFSPTPEFPGDRRGETASGRAGIDELGQYGDFGSELLVNPPRLLTGVGNFRGAMTI
jgi:hypothetical protein